MSMIAAALSAFAPALFMQAAPLTPVAKWSAERVANSCHVSGTFATRDGSADLRLSHAALAERVIVRVHSPALGSADVRHGKARLVFGAETRPVEADYVSVTLPHNEGRLSEFSVAASGLQSIASDAAVDVIIDGVVSMKLGAGAFATGLRSMADCEAETLRKWNIDPALLAAVVTNAVPANTSDWFAVDDYPPKALQARAEGVALIVWTIDKTGRVSDCRVVESSGNGDLDAASCRAIMKRGRYQPAKDKDGTPVPSYGSRRVYWTYPGAVRP